MKPSSPPITVMLKPAGARCNLRCDYCYFLDNAAGGDAPMSLSLLERFTRQYLRDAPGSHIVFYWQGGEPTLRGLDFYREAVRLQQRYRPPGMTIENHLQTNGVLLNDAWCAFFRQQRFLIGISIDGPAALHDRYRKNRAGLPQFDAIRRAVDLLHRHQVDFTTLTAVNRHNAQQPEAVYAFLRDEIASPLMQFIPVVETRRYAPRDAARPEPLPALAPWAVTGELWGTFLCTLFDRWYERDVGRHFVHYFEAALQIWLGYPSPLCTLAPHCGNHLALMPDGALYACDHYVSPAFQRGNIRQKNLYHLAGSPAQRQFGAAKTTELGARCQRCRWRFACHGDCPKNRLQTDEQGTGISLLCNGWQRFWQHIDPAMRQLARRLGHDGAFS